MNPHPMEIAQKNKPCLAWTRWAPVNGIEQKYRWFLATQLQPTVIPVPPRWIACMDGLEREVEVPLAWLPLPPDYIAA